MTDSKTGKGHAKKPFMPKILTEIRSLIETSRRHVAVTANLTLVQLYWNIGRIVTQDIQENERRADYGKKLITDLSDLLTKEYGKGFSRVNLQDMRRFFENFTIGQALPDISGIGEKSQAVPDKFDDGPILQSVPVKSSDTGRGWTAPDRSNENSQALPVESDKKILIDFKRHSHLGWTHYRILIGIKENMKRRFYFDQAARERWSTRELQRRIDKALFERVALSNDTKTLARLEREKGKPEVVAYEDIFKDPYILDFLGLQGAYLEKDLEAAVIHNMELFLTELGSDFCFMARQYPMRIDDVDYFLDLLFYHRGLRCLVAIDLKLGTFSAADKGQMDLYLAWLKQHEWREGENEPVGLILCTSKKRQHVELLLRHGPHKMQVSEYMTKLPSKKLLEDRLRLYGRLMAAEEGGK